MTDTGHIPKARRSKIDKPSSTLATGLPDWVIHEITLEGQRTQWSRASIARRALISLAVRLQTARIDRKHARPKRAVNG